MWKLICLRMRSGWCVAPCPGMDINSWECKDLQIIFDPYSIECIKDTIHNVQNYCFNYIHSEFTSSTSQTTGQGAGVTTDHESSGMLQKDLFGTFHTDLLTYRR